MLNFKPTDDVSATWKADFVTSLLVDYITDGAILTHLSGDTHVLLTKSLEDGCAWTQPVPDKFTDPEAFYAFMVHLCALGNWTPSWQDVGRHVTDWMRERSIVRDARERAVAYRVDIEKTHLSLLIAKYPAAAAQYLADILRVRIIE